ncbi:hypothetical protein HX744_18485 [Pseudonocardia sp. ICBG1122]|nr:hypothetical protein [Pseudonocardia pini]
MFAVRDPLRAAGHDAVLLAPRCPPVPEGATVVCRVDGVPATVEVTRVSGADHRVRLTVTPAPEGWSAPVPVRRGRPRPTA